MAGIKTKLSKVKQLVFGDRIYQQEKFDILSKQLDSQSLLLTQIAQLLNAIPLAREPDTTSDPAPSLIADGETLADLFLAQSGSLDGLAASLELQQSSQDAVLAEIRGKTDNLDNATANIAAMITGLIEQASGNTTLLARLGHVENAVANLPTLIASNSETANHQALQALAIVALEKRRGRKASDIEVAAKKTAYKAARKGSFDAQLEAMEQLVPENYSKWLGLFETGSKAYAKDPHGSCAVWGDAYAEGFRNFCALNLGGRVLDIGSGPLGKPVYLQGYPSRYISAIEPLEVNAKVDFELVRGFNENLPWPDRSFNCVVNSTSLDHVLSLEKALEETARVLCDDGRFIVWIGSIPGAKPYNPHDADMKPIDDFHMFHIDRKWFEPYIERWFRIEEKLEMPNASFTHIYYVFSKG